MAPFGRPLADDEAAIVEWLDEKPTMSRFAGAVRRFDEIATADPTRYEQLKVLFVRNFTVEPIEPYLRVAGYRGGLALEVSYSGYDPMVTAAADLAADPDVVIVALRLEELASTFVEELDVASRPVTADVVGDVVAAIGGYVQMIKAATRATVLVHNLAAPLQPPSGLSDTQADDGQLNAVRQINVKLSAALAELPGAYLLDVDHLFAVIGLATCSDSRGQRLSDAPYSQTGLRALADAEVRHLEAARGAKAKCVVVDCDNTLWGGVIGEDGIGGVVLSRTGPGRRYWDLQAALRRLRRRGIVLAIASKNEPDDVLEVLRSHPECILGEDDFVAMRINWLDKASNIRSLAEELNLGLGSIVFIDDNPVECEWVRTELPDVRVVEWPGGLDDGGTLDDTMWFDTLVLTAEDRARTEMYQAERQRSEVRSATSSLEDYLESLDMVATLGAAEAAHVGRIAQLTQKTNQFNLRTRRYDVGGIEAVVADPDARVVWLELSDRFGDHGIVGAGIVLKQGTTAFIDTLLLSCRVLGRGAEDLLVRRLAEHAADLGAAVLVGEYIPSERNGQVADLYGRLGFAGPEHRDGGSIWTWDLSDGFPQAPEWFKTVDLAGSAT